MKRLIASLLLAFPLGLTAQDLVEFQNGQVADADSLNQNLSLLLQKIEALDERVSLLEPEPEVCNAENQSLLHGTWKLSPASGSLGVGPAEFDVSWWSNDDNVTALRACYFDDQYVFGTGGTFQNILGDETWLEPWQGVEAEGCGTPISPHDGASMASFEYQCEAQTITISGIGSYLGLPKAVNGRELESADEVPESITYNAYFNDDGSMYVTVEAGAGVWWNYILVKSS